MTRDNSKNMSHPNLSADTRLWMLLCVAGISCTALLGLTDIVRPSAWCDSALHDVSLLVFTLPAFIALGLWVRAFYATASTPAQDVTSEAAQLIVALYGVAAFGAVFAQSFVGKPWLLGRLPLSVSLTAGIAALSPMFVWRIRPDWLRREKQ